MTRTFGDFWREWRAAQGLTPPRQRPEVDRFVSEPIPTAPAQRPPRVWPCYCGSTNFGTLPGGRVICNVCYRRRRAPHFEAA